MRKKLTQRIIPLMTILMLVSISIIFMQTTNVHAASSISGLHVSGNQLLNDANEVVRPLGVDRSGTEYMCNSGGVFDGPSDATSVSAMASWHINAVRVPLNEDCWLGINGSLSSSTAATYQQAIINYVNLLNSNNLIVILDLHWNAPGTTTATGQKAMPDVDHSPAFWTSVANTFKSNSSVIFDLYNEPHPSSWSCWLNGSSAASTSPCSDVPFAVAGMQTLVNTVRTAGATNVLMLGGLAYANNLSSWLQNEPTDPDNNLMASMHLYNFNGCNTTSCFDTQVAPVAAQVPIVIGELGETIVALASSIPSCPGLTSTTLGMLVGPGMLLVAVVFLRSSPTIMVLLRLSVLDFSSTWPHWLRQRRLQIPPQPIRRLRQLPQP